MHFKARFTEIEEGMWLLTYYVGYNNHPSLQ